MNKKKFEELITKADHELTSKQCATLAARMIEHAFVWSASKEGFGYWAEVYEKLSGKRKE